ncbi:MAG: hypothetical protein GXN93_03640 [Candidatus Diapherotrites archaeon]|nr:hypothetical protein [Candidatus Diapherotrites archaeon]
MEEFVHNLRKIRDFLESANNHRDAIYEWAADRNLREDWIKKNVPLKHQQFVRDLLEDISKHSEISGGFEWIDKATAYHTTGNFGREYVSTIHETLEKWREIISTLSQIAGVSKDPNIKFVAKDLEQKFENARVATKYLKEHPEIIERYLAEVRRQAEARKRAMDSLNEFEEL